MTSHMPFSRSFDKWLGSQIRRVHSRSKAREAREADEREAAIEEFLKNMRRSKKEVDVNGAKE